MRSATRCTAILTFLLCLSIFPLTTPAQPPTPNGGAGSTGNIGTCGTAYIGSVNGIHQYETSTYDPFLQICEGPYSYGYLNTYQQPDDNCSDGCSCHPNPGLIDFARRESGTPQPLTYGEAKIKIGLLQTKLNDEIGSSPRSVPPRGSRHAYTFARNPGRTSGASYALTRNFVYRSTSGNQRKTWRDYITEYKDWFDRATPSEKDFRLKHFEDVFRPVILKYAMSLSRVGKDSGVARGTGNYTEPQWMEPGQPKDENQSAISSKTDEATFYKPTSNFVQDQSPNGWETFPNGPTTLDAFRSLIVRVNTTMNGTSIDVYFKVYRMRFQHEIPGHENEWSPIQCFGVQVIEPSRNRNYPAVNGTFVERNGYQHVIEYDGVEYLVTSHTKYGETLVEEVFAILN